MVVRYDRTVPEELLAALDGGFAQSLVAIAREGRGGLDLQLRGYPGKSRHWATLYVGLTKILDLFYSPSKGFRVDANKAYTTKANRWEPEWAKWQTADKLALAWPGVENYLDHAFLKVQDRWTGKEGAVQAAFSAYGAHDFTLIDREAAVTFSNDAERTRISTRLSHPLHEALKSAPPAAWWKTAKPLGGECDALGIGADGAVLTIEVKPSGVAQGVTWSPMQVTHYANLFREWAATTTDDAAAGLEAMLAQRVRLGLAREGAKIMRPLQVRPMVVLGRPVVESHLDRMRQVQARLVAEGVGDESLRVLSIDMAGRTTEIEI